MKIRKRFICTSLSQKTQSAKYHGERRTQPLFFFLIASASSPSGVHPAPPIPANDIPNQSIQRASATLWSIAGEEGPSIAEVNSGTGTRGAVGRDIVEPDCVSSSGRGAPIRRERRANLSAGAEWVGRRHKEGYHHRASLRHQVQVFLHPSPTFLFCCGPLQLGRRGLGKLNLK